MNLREYISKEKLKDKKFTVDAFSKKIKCTRNHLSELAHGRRKCGTHLAMVIERETNGEVTAKELLEGKGNAGE